MEEQLDNGPLLDVIDEWIAADRADSEIIHVMVELKHGKCSLFIEGVEDINHLVNDEGEKKPKFNVNYYEWEGQKFFAAFTDPDILVQNVTVREGFLALPTDQLMQMAKNSGMDGIIINSGCDNAFVAYLKDYWWTPPYEQ